MLRISFQKRIKYIFSLNTPEFYIFNLLTCYMCVISLLQVDYPYSQQQVYYEHHPQQVYFQYGSDRSYETLQYLPSPPPCQDALFLHNNYASYNEDFPFHYPRQTPYNNDTQFPLQHLPAIHNRIGEYGYQKTEADYMFHHKTTSDHFTSNGCNSPTMSESFLFDFDTTSNTPSSKHLLSLIASENNTTTTTNKNNMSTLCSFPESKRKRAKRSTRLSNICFVCKKEFATPSSLLDHRTVHSGERRFKCTVCNLSFAHRSTLLKHNHTHTGKKPFVCDVCQKRFAQSGNMIRHRRSIHSVNYC